MCPHYVRVGRTKTETLRGHYFGITSIWYMSVMYTGWTIPKQKPLQAIILDLDLNGKVLRRMPFLPKNLAARLIEHVEEHGESIVKPDLTGH